MENNKIDFFISYTSKDEKWGTWVAKVLEDKGYSTIIQAWDFNPGTNFIQSMHKATIHCNRTIAILSEDYFKSLFTQPEWQAAFAQDPTSEKSTLIPIKTSDYNPEGLLKQIVYIDLFGLDEEDAKSKLLHGIDLSGRARNSTGFPGTKKQINDGELPFNNIKLKRNRNFIGRANILKQIKSTFNQKDNNSIYRILTGAGGVGKSQIALEYVYANGFNYDVVWWIDAEEPRVIIEIYKEFAREKGLTESGIQDSTIIISAINNWTNRNDKWLFIFDNAENVEQLYEYLPINPKGHIIITSRNPNWETMGDTIEVDVFSEEEALAFMRKKTSLKDESGLGTLLSKLDLLPLALEQASAYISKHDISYDKYNDLFDEFRLKILEKCKPLKYEYSVATTWLISLDKITNESSRQLLNIVAFLYADSIDVQFFTILSKYLVAPLSEKTNNVLEFNDIIYNLKEYSLIKYTSNTIRIHRLLQEVIQTYTDSKYWIRFLVNLVYEHLEFELDDNESWMTYKNIIDHIYSIANHGNRHKIELEKVAYLYHQTSYFFDLVLSDFRQSEIMLLEALKIREEILGMHSKATMITKNNLAGLYQDQGRYLEAEELYLNLISVCEEVFGDKDELLITSNDNLAKLYTVLGKYDEAKELFIWLIDKKISLYGRDDPVTAKTIGNFAILLKDLGELKQAEKLLLESYEIQSNVNGTQNEHVGSILDALGDIYLKKCQYDLAEKYFKDSLDTRRSIFIPEHSNIATSLNNLATLYMETYRFDEAEMLLNESLEISEKNIALSPSALASTYNNLGEVLYSLKKYETAEIMLMKALNLMKKCFEEGNVAFSSPKSNLGNLYMRLEKYDLAEPLLREALDIRRKILGIKHQDTIASVNNLGLLYNAQRKYDLAKPLLVQALATVKEIFGDKHKDTIESYYSLSVFYLQTKRTEKGIELLIKATELSREVLGNNHKTTIMIDDYFRNSVLPHVKIKF